MLLVATMFLPAEVVRLVAVVGPASFLLVDGSSEPPFLPVKYIGVLVTIAVVSGASKCSNLSPLLGSALSSSSSSREGRQKNRWEDDIRKWTHLEFAKSQRAVENREKWRKLVLKSSVVPKRPSRLRDK